ncbi:energy-coupling factor transporter transmembrane protein EcfT [Candidatus Binatia bacterium]|nr:energy-coupling factor transporter transmembrane protein EcfT [Candidatus Binatia bacterium]
MTSSLYVDRPGFLHAAHPLGKLLAFAAFFVAVFSLEQPLAIAPYVALLALAAVFAHAGPNLQRLRALLVVIPLGAIVVWTFFYRGRGAGAPFQPSSAGFLFGVGMGLKLLSFLLLNLILLSTTRVEELTAAFTRLGMPYRVGFALTLAFRLVPLFAGSASTVLQAQRLRSLGAEVRGVRARLAQTVPVILAVFMGALRRADQMAIALDMRGFALPGRRTFLLERPVSARDAVVVLVALGAPLSSWAIRAAGYGVFPR